jgi:hypothetical protein
MRGLMTSEKIAHVTSDAAKREDHSSTPHPKDQDCGKGAVEDDQNRNNQNHEGGNTSLTGQLGHRDEDPELKDADTDFPG